MAQCDGCEQDAVTEHKGVLLCADCVVTVSMWEKVQEAKARVQAKKDAELRAKLDAAAQWPASQRGDHYRTLANWGDSVMRYHEHH